MWVYSTRVGTILSCPLLNHQQLQQCPKHSRQALKMKWMNEWKIHETCSKVLETIAQLGFTVIWGIRKWYTFETLSWIKTSTQCYCLPARLVFQKTWHPQFCASPYHVWLQKNWVLFFLMKIWFCKVPLMFPGI